MVLCPKRFDTYLRLAPDSSSKTACVCLNTWVPLYLTPARFITITFGESKKKGFFLCL